MGKLLEDILPGVGLGTSVVGNIVGGLPQQV